MSCTDWLLIVSTIALWVLVAYGQWCLRCMERELGGKADKPKPRPKARRVSALQRFRVDEGGGDDVIYYICAHCGCDPVPKIGHTRMACERHQEKKREEQFKSAQPEEAHDPPMDRAPGSEEPGHDE